MPLRLESAQTVARGFFNPHIISPEWLVKNEVCEDEEVEVQFFPLSQGVAFAFNKDVKWQIDFRHLFVESLKANCGELVEKVIRLLPHTPIRAVGNNFHYASDKEPWTRSSLPMLGARGPDTFPELGRVEQTRWGSVSQVGEVRIEVTVADDEDGGFAVLFNFHRETKSAEESRQAALNFEDDKRWSERLLAHLLSQEVAR